MGIRPFFLGVGLYTLWEEDEKDLWATIFELAYHVKGFTYPIGDMPIKMRRWMVERLVKQKKFEEEVLRKARDGIDTEVGVKGKSTPGSEDSR